MSAVLFTQCEYFLRLVVAGGCGALIGFERKNRLKEAGIRTHLIVAMGAALIMIVSKYGFNDLASLGNVKLDPSRVAAQIVSGIGFLGAGMIFVKKQTVSGLTTAAGIWATSGVGMAAGAGMYFMAVAGTALIVVSQIIFHKNFTWLQFPVAEPINMKLQDTSEAITYTQKILKEHHIEIITIKIEKVELEYLDIEMYIKLPNQFDISELMNIFKDNPHVKSMEI